MKLGEIILRDPFILAAEGRYYLYGTRSETCWGPADGFDVHISRDLREWEGPRECFHNDGSFWADRNYWAPEVHVLDGAYYMFASFKSADRRRGTAVLRAERPEGPFRPWSEGNLTPAEWECLDGTLYRAEDGTPYLVFCHEWVQAGDGEILAMPLSRDLRIAAGEPRLLFRASQAPWSTALHHSSGKTGYVTDGPFLWRKTDGTLICLWAGFSADGYTQGLAVSDNGEIDGTFRQAKPLFRKDGGHGMIFRAYDGQAYLLLHSPNESLKEHPVLLPLDPSF